MTRISSLHFSSPDHLSSSQQAVDPTFLLGSGGSWRAETQRTLRSLGIESGHWALQEAPVSATPQLTYARQLLPLQARFGTVLTDRSSWRPSPRQAASERLDHEGEHSHDETEVRVLLAGHLRYTLRAPTLGGHVAIDLEAGDWIALPSGLPHRLEVLGTERVDLLRLFASRGGWRARTPAPQRLAPHPVSQPAWRQPAPADMLAA